MLSQKRLNVVANIAPRRVSSALTRAKPRWRETQTMAHLIRTTLALSLAAACVGAWSQTPAPPAQAQVKTLAVAADPLKKAVLIGRVAANGMVLQLELEGSEAMWMPMGNPPVWGAHSPGADERYHVELKLDDPKTKTRIPYANITFEATNANTGKTARLSLPPMWGSSGLHYSANSALLGDGVYDATVHVEVPTFQRELKDKDLWSKPVHVRFHFKLTDGKLTEVSAPGR
jgi:uncharacterized protein involved in high-affinity Fe2+ transport